MRTFKNTAYQFTVGGSATNIPAMGILSVNPTTNAVTLTNGTTVTPAEDVVSMLSLGQPSVDGNYFTDALRVTQPITAPTNGALTQTTSGALGATTYYVRSTWVTANGESLPSAETSLAVLANNVLNVAHPTGTAPANATGWNVYVSTSTGTETKQNTTPIAVGSAWVEPNSGLITGAALPTTNTANGPLWLLLCNVIRLVPNTGTLNGNVSFVVTRGATFGIQEIVDTYKGTDGLIALTTYGSNTVAPNAMTVPAGTEILVNPYFLTKQVGHALTTATTTSAENPIASINVLEAITDVLGWSE